MIRIEMLDENGRCARHPHTEQPPSETLTAAERKHLGKVCCAAYARELARAERRDGGGA